MAKNMYADMLSKRVVKLSTGVQRNKGGAKKGSNLPVRNSPRQGHKALWGGMVNKKSKKMGDGWNGGHLWGCPNKREDQIEGRMPDRSGSNCAKKKLNKKRDAFKQFYYRKAA